MISLAALAAQAACAMVAQNISHLLWYKIATTKRTKAKRITAVASMRRTEALASVKFYQILSIFIFFIRLIILEDFIRQISYKGPCVRLGCSFFLATALRIVKPFQIE